jgi:hypothetical protein
VFYAITEINEDEMDRTCSTFGEYDKYMQHFSQKTQEHRGQLTENIKIDIELTGCILIGFT